MNLISYFSYMKQYQIIQTFVIYLSKSCMMVQKSRSDTRSNNCLLYHYYYHYCYYHYYSLSFIKYHQSEKLMYFCTVKLSGTTLGSRILNLNKYSFDCLAICFP